MAARFGAAGAEDCEVGGTYLNRFLRLIVVTVLLAGACAEQGGATPQAASPAPLPSAATGSPARTIPNTTPSPTPLRVLDERYGFIVTDKASQVRSETSGAVISSFALPPGRSFTSLSRVVSPDGRFLAYWDPVDSGAVLHVRSVTGSESRAVLTRPGLSGNAFTWSSDSGGLVAALDNNCFEICDGLQVPSCGPSISQAVQRRRSRVAASGYRSPGTGPRSSSPRA